MSNKSMAEHLFDAGTKYPQHIALNCLGKEISYADLLLTIQSAAVGLRGLGIVPGERVLISLPNLPQTVAAIYALNLLGAVPAMVHPLSTGPELAHYAQEVGSRWVICLDLQLGRYRSALASHRFIIINPVEGMAWNYRLAYTLKRGQVWDRGAIHWSTLIQNPASIQPHLFHPREPALILFSGGTTGTPKGVLLSNNNLNALAEQVLSQIDPKPGQDSMVCVLPFFHGFGLGVCLHPVLAGGGRCILLPRFNAKDFARVINRERPTYIAGVPTLYRGMLTNPALAKADLSFLKGAYCGGDTTSPQLRQEFRDFVKARGGRVVLQEGYGLTETVTACTVMPPGEERQGSVGPPLPGMRIKIVIPGTETALPPGQEGEICIHGPTVMLGYSRGDETAQVLKEHGDGLWLHTGDLGLIDEQGYLYFRQRIKRIIKRAGYSVYPSQIEEVLLAHPKVKQACVIGLPDTRQGQKIKAFVVSKGPGRNQLLVEEIMAYLAERLVKWSLPQELELCDQLPLTHLGKIAYARLEEVSCRQP